MQNFLARRACFGTAFQVKKVKGQGHFHTINRKSVFTMYPVSSHVIPQQLAV